MVHETSTFGYGVGWIESCIKVLVTGIISKVLLPVPVPVGFVFLVPVIGTGTGTSIAVADIGTGTGDSRYGRDIFKTLFTSPGLGIHFSNLHAGHVPN